MSLLIDNDINSRIDEKVNIILKKMQNIEEITKLVLSGGGIKGIAHVGVLQALEDKNILKNIKTIAGCSSGALVAFLYTIGYSPKELYKISMKFDFTKFKSPNIKIINLLDKFGLENGSRLIKILKLFLKKKKIDENITFEKLYNITGINLIINSSCLNDKECYYFSYTTYPKLDVITAVRMSTAFPLFFTPVKFDNKLFTDGGCIDNFPMHLFNNNPNNVIGIYLDSKISYQKNINNLENFLINTIECLFMGMSDIYTKNYKNIVKIVFDSVNVLEFDLSEVKKYDIYIRGYNQTLNFFKNKICY